MDTGIDTKIYSVSEFVSGVNQLLAGIPAVVQGEISNFRVAQNRFVWFDLKDEDSYVSCFMLKFQLDQELEDGMEIQVMGHPGLFKKSGRFHLRVNKIQLVGEGTLKRQFELLKSKLTKEGIFDEDRKRSLPRFPRRIGLVTSADAAAFTDVQRILKNRWAGLEIFHFPVQVQGDQAVSSVLQALSLINAKYQNVLDVVILTRGGGSLEDLQAFNDESVVRAVFGLKVPSIVGIGHERDETLAEYAADVRASTPSNAAEFVVPDKRDVIYQLGNLVAQQERSLERAVRTYADKVNDAITVLDAQAHNYNASVQVIQQRFMLAQTNWQNSVKNMQAQVHHAIQLLQSYNPQHILNRGYSITRDTSGQVVTSHTQVRSGDSIQTVVKDGEITSKVL